MELSFLKDDIHRKSRVRFKATNVKMDKSWIVKTLIITFTMSAVFNVLSGGVMKMVSIWIACLILLLIVLTGILFDIIGVAVTTADEPPFHSMAAKKIPAAVKAISLIKTKDKVSNFCNDVVGDICGIVSGSASAAVVAYIVTSFPGQSSFLMSLCLTALVAAITVGGKAVGKSVAIKYSNYIVYNVAKVMTLFRFKR